MAEEKVKKQRYSFSVKRTAIGVVAGMFVFYLGIAVGSGRVRLGDNRIFHNGSQNHQLPADLDYSSVEQVYDSLKSSYDGKLDAQQLLDGLKKGLAEATGDQYTEYLNSDKAKEFDSDLNGSFTGIGAELGKQDDLLVVVSPIAGFPADKAGLRPQDVISKIDGEPSFNLSISDAVNKIRGPKGTKVKLTIVRDKSKELEFEIERDQITIPSVTSEILDGNIGYMKISRFGEDTSGLSRQAADKFKAAGVKSVILDVRGNPGGLLDAAVDLSSLWLPSGKTVLQEKRDDVVVRTYKAKGNAVLAGTPTVVLINEGSASASEITAGALKDNGAATLIGQKSYGKGSVQQLENLAGGSVLKVTIARWYTPNGKNIDKAGIEPDQKVDRTDEDYAANRDPQKDAAITFLKK